MYKPAQRLAPSRPAASARCGTNAVPVDDNDDRDTDKNCWDLWHCCRGQWGHCNCCCCCQRPL